MRQITFEKDAQTQSDIDAAKEFFGTVSEAAAVRSAITLAQLLARTAKNGRILVRDQNKGGCAHIVIAR